MSYCYPKFGCSESSCSAGCGDFCSGRCTSTAGNCAPYCEGFCKGGCYNGCAHLCDAECNGSCSGGCTSSCAQGCSNNCTGGCNTGCKTGCKDSCKGTCKDTCEGTCKNTCTDVCTGCKSTCKNLCNETCTSTAQKNNYKAVIAMSDIIKYNEANTLRNFINNELTRRGKTPTTISNLTLNQTADASWWNAIIGNINKVLDSSDDRSKVTANTSIIDKDERDAVIDLAVELYEELVPVN